MRLHEVNYTNASDQQALVELLNAYAEEPIGGGASLSPEVKRKLCGALAEHPGAFSFIVYDEQSPVGLLNAFTGFSTFKARPLVNIHDVYVAPTARGRGVVEILFQAVEEKARSLGCCKLTLEVLEKNTRAQAAYRKLGYLGYDLGEEGGSALFWQKSIDNPNCQY